MLDGGDCGKNRVAGREVFVRIKAGSSGLFFISKFAGQCMS